MKARDESVVERWMSTGTAARVLGVERTTAWRYAKEGFVLSKKLPSGRWLVAFPVQKLRDFDAQEK